MGDVGVHCDIKTHPSTGTLSTENDVEWVWRSRDSPCMEVPPLKRGSVVMILFHLCFPRGSLSPLWVYVWRKNVVGLGQNLNSSKWWGMPFPSSRKSVLDIAFAKGLVICGNGSIFLQFTCDFPNLDISETRFWIWIWIPEKKTKRPGIYFCGAFQILQDRGTYMVGLSFERAMHFS